MTVFGKQELGWVVPEFLQPGETRDGRRTGPRSRPTPARSTGSRRDGEPYTLSEANGDQNIHNGQAYGLKLPPRQTHRPRAGRRRADPADRLVVRPRQRLRLLARRRRTTSTSTCPSWPTLRAGHAGDRVASSPAGTSSGTSTTASCWSAPTAQNYTSLPSENGYTTADGDRPQPLRVLPGAGRQRPHRPERRLRAGRGRRAPGRATRSRTTTPSAARSWPTPTTSPTTPAWRTSVLRFSYSTDPAFDRAGWFIDDLAVTAGEEVLYASDFESGDEPGRLFPGGCNRDGFNVALVCTEGWGQVRRRRGLADRPRLLPRAARPRRLRLRRPRARASAATRSGSPACSSSTPTRPTAYGNNGVPLPPAQHYLDPTAGAGCPVPGGRDLRRLVVHRRRRAQPLRDVGLIQSFEDPAAEERDGVASPWLFDYGCLDLTVTRLDGEEVTGAELPSDLSADATITAG